MCSSLSLSSNIHQENNIEADMVVCFKTTNAQQLNSDILCLTSTRSVVLSAFCLFVCQQDKKKNMNRWIKRYF